MKKNIKNIKNKKRNILPKFTFIFLLFCLILIVSNVKMTNNISIGLSIQHQKYWVGGKYKLLIYKCLNNSIEKIYLRISNNRVEELSDGYFLMKSSGRECITAYMRNKKSKICFTIYNTPELKFKETNPIKIEINNVKQVNLVGRDYPKLNVNFISNHPDIIKINNEGKITAMRPGNAIITAMGLDGKKTQIKVVAFSNNGLINNYTLDQNNASQYQKVMIVAHPDDETLWGGAHLIKERYFVVCLTNGYNLDRANDYREILKFTKNNGIILNHPDLQDNIIDDWSEFGIGIKKDLSKIIKYKFWETIVTHGPDGTTGHIHHKKICEYITKITKECNIYKNLYYFGTFFAKNKMPKYLSKISDEELEYKKKLVVIYKSKRDIIYKEYFHMLPYENWILASNWKE